MSKNYTVGMALSQLSTGDAPAAKAARAALRPTFPECAEMSASEFGVHLNSVPLHIAKAMLNEDGPGWSPEVEVELASRGFTSHTYRVHYPAAVRRLVTLGESLSARPGEVEILPEWLELIELFKLLCPGTKEQVIAFREGGVKLLGVHDLRALTVEQASKKAQMARWSFNILARRASAAGLTPHEFGVQVLHGERLDDLASFTPKNTYHFYARDAYNLLAAEFPERGLASWPDFTKRVGIQLEDLNVELRESSETAFFSAARCAALEPTSLKTFRTTVTGYYGILVQAGIDLSFTVGLAPKDAFRLLWQSMPREILTGNEDEDAPMAIAAKIMRDEGFRDRVLAAMRAMEGSYEGLEAVENPFVAIAREARYDAGQYPAARNLMQRVREANRDYISIRGRHLAWIDTLDKEIKRLHGRAKTSYRAKKQAVFRHPRLWEQLMKRVELMIVEFERMTPGTPRWATTLRNLLFVFFLLLIPLRINAFIRMELVRHFDPDAGTLHFDEDEVKNDVVIDYVLPAKGRYAKIRQLIKLYMDQGRPILLHGAVSPFFFVPDRSAPNAGLHIREKGFNEILKDLSDRYFRDVLPAGIPWLNPHLARHVVATFQVKVHQDWVLAAQLLGNKMETVLEFYADVLGSASQDVKTFYESQEEDPDGEAACMS